ncbi:SIR2 family protein [bacterium]|nr:SIR2 family protein [bacterium]
MSMNSLKTVALLGSGFSRAMSLDCSEVYPTSAQILSWETISRAVADPLIRAKEDKRLRKPWYKRIPGAIRSILEDEMGMISPKDNMGWVDPLSQEAANFETMLSYCMAISADASRLQASRHNAQEALLEMSFFLARVLDVFYFCQADRNKMALTVEKFLKQLPFGSMIHTTNYDNLLEDCYLAAEEGVRTSLPSCRSMYSKAIEQQRLFHEPKDLSEEDRFRFQYNVVKLHGSINWSECQRTECPSYWNPNVKIAEFRDRRSSFGWLTTHCPLCGAMVRPAIFPPLTLKDYNSRFYSTKALGQLQWDIYFAKRLILIGYGFAENDIAIRSVVTTSLRDSWRLQERTGQPIQVEHIDTSEEKRQRLRRFLTSIAKRGSISYRGFSSMQDWHAYCDVTYAKDSN